MTAALDQRVKLWNFDKVLLLQVTSNEPIDSAMLVNGLDIMLAHSKKLSMLRIKQFGLDASALEKVAAETVVHERDLV